MTKLGIPIKFWRLSETAKEPDQAYDNAVGWDMYADIPDLSHGSRFKLDFITIPPNTTAKIPTGWAVTLPTGYYASIRSRSGLSVADNPLFVANSPGTIDPDYRGEVCILLYNAGIQSYIINDKAKIAQLVVDIFTPSHSVIISHPPLDNTKRGSKGYGSSGV